MTPCEFVFGVVPGVPVWHSRSRSCFGNSALTVLNCCILDSVPLMMINHPCYYFVFWYMMILFFSFFLVNDK